MADFRKLLTSHKKIHYYQVQDIPSQQGDIVVYRNSGKQTLNYSLIQKCVSKDIPIIVMVDEITDSDLNLLEDPLITVICNKLRHYQKLLSYKTEKNLFINHHGLELAKRVILLIRDKKRVEHVEQTLKPQLKNLRVFRAIDAMTPNAIDNFVEENHFPVLQAIRAGKIGCAFSHISIWKELIHSLYPSVMILEDDIQPTSDYNQLIEEIYSELPVTFDILFLYISPKFYRNDPSVQIPGKKYINNGYYTEDISAYVMSRKGARKLLKKFRAIKEPLEIMLTKEIQQGELEAYTAKKMVFENIGQKTATQENILESNTYDSKIYDPE